MDALEVDGSYPREQSRAISWMRKIDLQRAVLHYRRFNERAPAEKMQISRLCAGVGGYGNGFKRGD